MSKFWGLAALSFLLIFNLSVNARLCAQGAYMVTHSILHGNVERDEITRNIECPDPEDICHRMTFTVHALQQQRKYEYYF